MAQTIEESIGDDIPDIKCAHVKACIASSIADFNGFVSAKYFDIKQCGPHWQENLAACAQQPIPSNAYRCLNSF